MKMISFADFLHQGEEIRSLQGQIEAHRMVHAVLISGEKGTGKKTLAFLIARALLCQSDHGIPCGLCNGCRLSLSGEHPDLIMIEKGAPLTTDTAKGRNSIPVEDIREMIRKCSRYSYNGGNRVVLIPDADNMTIQAQNSLLKILEEPPGNTYFIMTSSHTEQILSTVLSRCRTIKMSPWENDDIQKILTESGISSSVAAQVSEVSNGSIGNAFKLASDERYWKLREEIMDIFFRNRSRSEILSISVSWKDRKNESEMLFSILEIYLHKLLKYRLLQKRLVSIDEFPPEWQRFSSFAEIERFVFLKDKIMEARKQNESNVNFQAIMEQLLLVFIGECESWAE